MPECQDEEVTKATSGKRASVRMSLINGFCSFEVDVFKDHKEGYAHRNIAFPLGTFSECYSFLDLFPN